MVADVSKAIAKKLKLLYPTYKVYVDKIKQGFTEPCFFIKIIDVKDSKKLNLRRERTISFDIMAFLPQNQTGSVENINFTLMDISDNLQYDFEKVSISNKNYRTLKRESKIEDDVLHFTFNMNITLYEQKIVAPNMNEIDIYYSNFTSSIDLYDLYYANRIDFDSSFILNSEENNFKSYHSACGTTECGTEPFISTNGKLLEQNLNLEVSDKNYMFNYIPCGTVP